MEAPVLPAGEAAVAQVVAPGGALEVCSGLSGRGRNWCWCWSTGTGISEAPAEEQSSMDLESGEAAVRLEHSSESLEH